MAGETEEADPTVEGSVEDIAYAKSPQRINDFKAANQGASDAFNSTLNAQKLQAQHRQIMANMGNVNQVNDLPTQTITTAAGAYSQTDFQATLDLIAALMQVLAQVVTVVNFQRATIIENLKKPE